jgi:arylsulfatase A-like enzyme
MTVKNITSSPLTKIAQSYEIKEQILRQEDAFLYSLDNDEYWAIPTAFPLIAENDLEEPEGMAVFWKNQELPFLGNVHQNKQGWMWTRFIKHIEPERDSGYKRFKQRNTLVLSKDQYYRSENFYIPKGTIEFRIRAGSQNPEEYAPHIKVFLDEQLIRMLPVREMKFYRFSHELEPGSYKLEVGFSSAEKYSSSDPEEHLILDTVELKSTHDFILHTYLTQQTKSAKVDKFRAVYHTYVGDKKLYPIYLMRKKYQLLDLGIGENPLEMKKKLVVKGQSINAIFSPPRTELKYEVKIPEKGVLDFGYGLMQRSFRHKGDGVQFHIDIKTRAKEERIFSSTIDPFKNVDHRIVFRKKIDLSDYENKRIELVFVTEKNGGIHNDLSYWANPCIYQQKELLNTQKKKPTNVILISLDTLRADHLGCYGYSRDTSPNIDNLSKDSVLFNSCYSTAPSTLIAHMSLMTSLNPKSHRVYNDKAGDTLSPEFLTLADVLRGHGYYCGAFTGSGLVSAIFGFSKGFDEYHEDRYSIFKGNSAENSLESVSNWLSHNSDKKFFLFLHTYQPHNPYKNNSSFGKTYLSEDSLWQEINIIKHLRDLESENPASYPAELKNWPRQILENNLFKFRKLSRDERQNVVDLYDGEIRHTDEYLVKPLLGELKRLNIYENTMIILLSDHGEGFQDHKMWEHGVQLYNELIRVPLIIKYPSSKFKGKRVDKSVGLIDVLPSILEELGIELHEQFEGKHIEDIIDGTEDLDRICYAEARAAGRIVALVRGHDKLIFNGAPKSIYRFIGVPSQIEYYDLDKDPSENNNIEVESQTDLDALFKQLIEYWKDTQYTRESPQKKAWVPQDLEEQLRALGYIK